MEIELIERVIFVFFRTYTNLFFEKPGKIRRVVKAKLEGDLGNVLITDNEHVWLNHSHDWIGHPHDWPSDSHNWLDNLHGWKTKKIEGKTLIVDLVGRAFTRCLSGGSLSQR